jgi:hypothetical protein
MCITLREQPGFVFDNKELATARLAFAVFGKTGALNGWKAFAEG